MPYFVSLTDVTPWEPTIGWYYVDDNDLIAGPFDSQQDAMDAMDGDVREDF